MIGQSAASPLPSQRRQPLSVAHLELLALALHCNSHSALLLSPHDVFCSYLSIVKQQEAATASSGQNAIIFVISGVLVLAGSAITNALGLGWYMTMLAAIHFAVAVVALWQILRVRAQQRQHLPVVESLDSSKDATANP